MSLFLYLSLFLSLSLSLTHSLTFSLMAARLASTRSFENEGAPYILHLSQPSAKAAGVFALATSDHRLCVCQVATLEPIVQLKHPCVTAEGATSGIAFHPRQEELLLSSTTEGSFIAWDLRTAQKAYEFSAGSPIHCFHHNVHSSLILLGSKENGYSQLHKRRKKV